MIFSNLFSRCNSRHLNDISAQNKDFVRTKDAKGITLVALVVTIIVLLILAGVTISLIMNNNGIINRAIEARDETKNKSDKEIADIESLGNYINEQVGASGSSSGPTPGGDVTPPAVVKDITTITTTDHVTLKAKDKHGNIVTVPEGFKVVPGKAGEEITVQNGVVIEDSDGNQFVWIPVGTVTKNNGTKSNEIVLGRYTFADNDSPDPAPGTPTLVQNANEYAATTANIVKSSASTVSQYKIEPYYYELSDQREGLVDESDHLNDLNATAKNLSEFVQSVKDNGGYYLARYEASYGSGYNKDGTTDAEKYQSAKPLSKPSTANSTSSMNYASGTLWNFITQLNASKVARNMYAGNKDIDEKTVGVESDLVNSYAWDTAIVYIQEMGYTNYANQTDGNGTLKDTGTTGDIKCNIYDMAANTSEWNTEYATLRGAPCMIRGGGYYSSKYYPGLRFWGNTGCNSYATASDSMVSFRVSLYVK